MKKKKYISPSMHWIWLGLNKQIAQITIGGVETSTARTTRVNVWGTEESSDENEVWGQSW